MRKYWHYPQLWVDLWVMKQNDEKKRKNMKTLRFECHQETDCTNYDWTDGQCQSDHSHSSQSRPFPILLMRTIGVFPITSRTLFRTLNFRSLKRKTIRMHKQVFLYTFCRYQGACLSWQSAENNEGKKWVGDEASQLRSHSSDGEIWTVTHGRITWWGVFLAPGFHVHFEAASGGTKLTFSDVMNSDSCSFAFSVWATRGVMGAIADVDMGHWRMNYEVTFLLKRKFMITRKGAYR
jgi:hypothetical protein